MKDLGIQKLLLSVFGIVWILIIFFDYYNKHPFYELSFVHYPWQTYIKLTVLVLLAVGTIFIKNIHRFLFTGFGVVGLFALISLICAWSYTPFSEGEDGLAESFVYTGKALYHLFALGIIYLGVYSIGYLFLKIVDFDIRESSRSIYAVVIGIMVFTLTMFLLAMLGLLYNFILLPLLTLPILFNYKKNLFNIKNIFLPNTNDKEEKPTRFASLYLILTMLFLTINFMAAMAPFPSGFDSRNYYVNISKLLQDSNGLVEGFQSYTWSLFMSLGNIAFGNMSITLLISYSGILLVLWAIWELCRNYLRFNLSESALVLLLISVVPSIYNQMYVELKIDFGLLFVQMCSLLLLIDIVDKIRKTGNSIKDKELIKLFVLFGIFSGFAMGIKVTHLYMLFGVFMILWTIYCKYFGFLAIFFFSLFIIFIGRLDDVSGMRSYHLGMSYLPYVVLVLSLIFFGISLYKYKDQFMASLKSSVIISCMTVLVFLPWVVKNYSDTGKVSLRSMIIGTNPGPNITIQKVIRNYNESKK